MFYWVEIEIENPTANPHTFTIPKGRMISPKDPKSKVQNLVVQKSTKVTVPANGKAVVTVPTGCTDPPLKGPDNTPMDITTFGQRERSSKVFPGRTM
jgi:hypothetical protein